MSKRLPEVKTLFEILPKGLYINNLGKIALRFGIDLAALIEQNRRHSKTMLRILRLKSGQI